MTLVRALWAYRHFILAHVRREFQQRYTHSLLGAAWAVLQPLMTMLMYTIVFSHLMHPTLSGAQNQPFAYSIYLCAGLLPWNAFAEMLGRLQNMFVQHGNLLKKAQFPRACLPIIVLCSTLVDFAIIFGLYLIFLAIMGHLQRTTLSWFMLIFAIQCVFTMGLGLLTATLNVFFRDVGHIVGVVVQWWFWFTPIVYTVHALPEWVQTLLWVNPLYPLIQGYQNLFLHHIPPNVGIMALAGALSIGLLWAAGRFFTRLSGDMVDEL